MFCNYKNIFGEVGQGPHSYRVFNIAIVDVLATVIIAYCISWVTQKKIYYVLPLLFLLGIVAHRLFCVKTTIDKLLFTP